MSSTFTILTCKTDNERMSRSLLKIRILQCVTWKLWHLYVSLQCDGFLRFALQGRLSSKLLSSSLRYIDILIFANAFSIPWETSLHSARVIKASEGFDTQETKACFVVNHARNTHLEYLGDERWGSGMRW